MASRLAAMEKCISTCDEIRKGKKHRYIIFRISKDHLIDIETIGKRAAKYEQFLEDLRNCGPAECRYGLFDFEYVHKYEGTLRNTIKEKMIFIIYCPATAKPERKTLYALFSEELRKSLPIMHKYIHAEDIADITKEAIEEQLRIMDRN